MHDVGVFCDGRVVAVLVVFEKVFFCIRYVAYRGCPVAVKAFELSTDFGRYAVFGSGENPSEVAVCCEVWSPDPTDKALDVASVV